MFALRENIFVKSEMKHFNYYEKIVKADLNQQVSETTEYHNFSEVYPHIAESVKLKRNLKRLKQQLKSTEHQGSKFRIKREINLTKSELRKNSLNKRLHGENKQEALFLKQLKRGATKTHYSFLIKKRPKKCQSTGTFRLKLKRFMHRKLPPTLLNLREHDVSEKGMILKEWLQEKREELDKVLH